MSFRQKHDILIAPNNRRCSIPSSPSDYHAAQNFYQDVNRLFQEYSNE